MRRIHALAIATLLVATGCGPTGDPVVQLRPENACRASRDAQRLETLRMRLDGHSTRAAYYDALRGIYADLGEVAAEASNLTGVINPREQIACLATAAEASMTQAYLPTAERTGLPPSSSSPAESADESADQAVALCPTAEDARYCGIAKMIAAATLPQDAFDQFYGLAKDAGSTDTVPQWQAAETLIVGFGASARTWSETLDDVADGSPDAPARQTARDYLTPIACGVFTDAGVLRTRAPQPEMTALTGAFESFAQSYLGAMKTVADELDLPDPPAAAEACAREPEGFTCREAPAGAVLGLCESFWGQGG